MKKILTMLLAGIMILTFAACDDKTDSNNQPDNNNSNTTQAESGTSGTTGTTNPVDLNAPQKGSRLDTLLRSYWKYAYFDQDPYLDGYQTLKSVETDENGVEIKRVYNDKTVAYDPATDTLTIDNGKVEFNQNGQPVSAAVDGYGRYTYDEDGYLVAREIPRFAYTYTYSKDRKTVTRFLEGRKISEYTLNDRDLIVTNKSYDIDEFLVDTIIYEYDEEGRRVKASSQDKSGELFLMYERTFDEKGNVIAFVQ